MGQTAWWAAPFRWCCQCLLFVRFLSATLNFSPFIVHWNLAANKFYNNVPVGQSRSRSWNGMRLRFLLGYHSSHFHQQNTAVPDAYLKDCCPFGFVSELRSPLKHLGCFLVHRQCSRRWCTTRFLRHNLATTRFSIVCSDCLLTPFPLCTFPW